MALLKAARVAEVPTLDVVVPDLAAASARILGTLPRAFPFIVPALLSGRFVVGFKFWWLNAGIWLIY